MAPPEAHLGARSIDTPGRVGFVSLTGALDLTAPAAFELGLAHPRQYGKRPGRPATTAVHAAEIRKLHRKPNLLGDCQMPEFLGRRSEHLSIR